MFFPMFCFIISCRNPTFIIALDKSERFRDWKIFLFKIIVVFIRRKDETFINLFNYIIIAAGSRSIGPKIIYQFDDF